MAEAPSGAAGRGDEAGGRIRRWTFGGIRMCEITRAGIEVRWADEADVDPDERRFLVVLQMDGSALVAHGFIEVPLRTGDIAVIEGGRARWSDAGGRCRQLRLHLPPAWLRSRLPAGRIPPVRVLDGGTGLGRLLAGLLAGLPDAVRDEAGSLDAAAQAAVRDAVVGLVVAALSGADPAGGETGRRRMAPAAAHRWPSVCAFIEARLPEPSLCPADVARAHGISTRQLHRLFREAGTSFGAFLRDLRLARCRADLTDPRCAALPVTAIAYRWGFSDSAHFSRSFRAAYGTTARAFRSRVLRLPQFASEAVGSGRRARSSRPAPQISPASGDEGSA